MPVFASCLCAFVCLCYYPQLFLTIIHLVKPSCFPSSTFFFVTLYIHSNFLPLFSSLPFNPFLSFPRLLCFTFPVFYFAYISLSSNFVLSSSFSIPFLLTTFFPLSSVSFLPFHPPPAFEFIFLPFKLSLLSAHFPCTLVPRLLLPRVLQLPLLRSPGQWSARQHSWW